jgi:hypothetical protein
MWTELKRQAVVPNFFKQREGAFTMITIEEECPAEIDMRATLIKFSKRKNFFGSLETEWANLFQGRRAEEEEEEDEGSINALFGEEEGEEATSPKKRRALELSSSFTSSNSKLPLEKVSSLHTYTKKAEKDIALANYHNNSDMPTEKKRTKTHPSKVEPVNEWFQQVLKYGQSGSVGLVPEPWQSKFPLPSSSKLQLLKGPTLDVLEHYAQWREKKQ